MFKRFFLMMISVFSSFSLSALDCIQSVEFGVGWRRDFLDWKLKNIEESCVSATASSHIEFEKINYYTAHAKGHWVDSEYYIRASADYGLTDKGRAEERFKIDSSLIGGSFSTSVGNPIKRRSEAYDFSVAVGYPFMSCDNHFMFVPLIGYSYHRQRLRVKEECSSSFSSDFSFSSDNIFFPGESGSLSEILTTDSSSSETFDPFSCTSPCNVAEIFGLSRKKSTDNYRFTWYGPFVGVDLAWALDCTWTVFAELECHFLDRCHRKRNSYTAVEFIDHYHAKHWAMGFNGTFGTTFYLGECWYSTLAVDFKYWNSDQKHDKLLWKSAGINITMGYIF